MNDRIYVAGHTGLVGSAIWRRLEAEGFTDLVGEDIADLDLTDQRAATDYMAETRPDHVLIAAAMVGGIVANNTRPADFITINLEIQSHLIHAAWKTGVKRLIFLGSSCIYPRGCPQPMHEDHLLTGTLEPTNQPYALAKIAGIIQCEAYNRQHGTEYLALMPTNLYGVNDNYNLVGSHVLPAMVRKCHLARLAREGDREAIARDEARFGEIPADIRADLFPADGGAPRVTLWGTGSPYREFLYVDDLAGACHHLLTLEEEPWQALLHPPAPADHVQPLPLVNVGTGLESTIRDMAGTVAAVVGWDGEIRWDATKPDGTPRKLLDVGRLKATGWAPQVSLKEGLSRAYRWYREQIEG